MRREDDGSYWTADRRYMLRIETDHHLCTAKHDGCPGLVEHPIQVWVLYGTDGGLHKINDRHLLSTFAITS